jgi:hypothetical protein
MKGEVFDGFASSEMFLRIYDVEYYQTQTLEIPAGKRCALTKLRL